MAHKKMPIEMRAKQFLPFSALTGLEEALELKENEHNQNTYKYLGEKESNSINKILKKIQDNKNKLIEIIYENENGLNTIITLSKDINIDNNSLKINKSNFYLNQIIQIKLLN